MFILKIKIKNMNKKNILNIIFFIIALLSFINCFHKHDYNFILSLFNVII